MDSFSAGHSGLGAAAEQLLDRVGAIVGLAGADDVKNFREALTRPTAVAVAGRVNTGKSTLVNGLIGTKMAATSAQETTTLLSYYLYGAPTRAEAVLRTGESVSVPIGAAGPGLGNIAPDSVRSLRIYLQSAALRTTTIIDTPGLESATTGNSARTREAFLAEEDTGARADVLLFVVRGAFRPDDEDFIARFRKLHSANQEQPPVRVIGLLAHADNFGGGPWRGSDPIDDARKAAPALASGLPGLTAVLPVSALLAETVRTGALTEQDARVLRRLADVDDVHLQVHEQLGPPAGVDADGLRRLVQLIGGYGLRYGRRHCGSLSELLAWLHDRSGLDQVEQALARAVTGPADCSRVESLLSNLMATARARSWPQEARSLIEAARHSPAFHRLQERSALELLKATQPAHDLVPVLEELAGDGDWPAALTPRFPDAAGYLELASKYQSLIGTAPTGAEAKAIRTIARSLVIRSAAAGKGIPR